MNDMYDKEKEVREAIQAGERALSALQDAEKYLSSASGWGLVDMFGGGFISSMIKHSKMNDAQRSVERAQCELQRFSNELRDVQNYGRVQINFDGFTKFIDVFCDNFLVDVFVQSKIKETQRNVEATKRKVQEAIRKLENL